MKITYKGDYALKSVLDLAVHYGEIVTIHDLAGRAEIPIKFLEQVLLELKRGGFLESRRGKVGGYMLAKKPKDIKVGQVIRFIDGPLEPIACVEKHYSGCRDIYKCAFRDIWKRVSESTAEIVDNVSFEDLAKKVRAEQGLMAYSI